MDGSPGQGRRDLVGDPRAVEDCYYEYGPMVASYLRRLVPPQDADDLLQQVFLELWRARGRYDPDRPMSAWLLGIAHKRAVDHLRRQGRAEVIPSPTMADWQGTDPGRVAEGVTDRAVVLGALEKIPAEQRETLVLAYFADLSQSQIAARLGIPLGTVKARSTRGLRNLAAVLAPEEPS